jgi:hypothetical protein
VIKPTGFGPQTGLKVPEAVYSAKLGINMGKKQLPAREMSHTTVTAVLPNKPLKPETRKMPHYLIQNGVRMGHDLNLLCSYIPTFQ